MQLAEAVAAMHRAGVLHRDIKPDNLLLSNTGNLMLNDFDASCLERDASARRDTQVGCAVPLLTSNLLFNFSSGSRGLYFHVFNDLPPMWGK